MMFLIQTTLIGFATLCVAQLSGLPTCAKPCASSLPSQCNLDVSCICSDSSWITGISCCILHQCSPADQQQTLNVAVQLCDTVNVKLPSAASCPSSASATAANSAVAGGNSAASAGDSTTGLSASAATNSPVSGAETTSSSSASGVSATSTSATGSSSSTTTSTSSSATPASGAGQALGSNMGAVGAAVAALALL